MRQLSFSQLRKRHLFAPLGLAVAICLALIPQIWLALQRYINFDSDEAILALMARHIMQGDIPTYFYGQHYLGSFEPLLSAGFMAWLGSDIWTFRISALLLFAIFLALHGVLVWRLWDFRVALLSIAVLALPDRLIRMWTFRPISGIATIFVLGTGLLLLAITRRRAPGLPVARLFGAGVMIGLGFWVHPMIVIYLVTLIVIFWLQMPEWHVLYQRLDAFCDRVLGVSVRRVMPLVTLGLLVLGILAFFSSGCRPQQVFAIGQTVARGLVLVIVGGVAALLWSVSRRRGQLVRGGGLLIAGVVLGNTPQWRAWLFFNIAPDSAVKPACPTEVVSHLRLLAMSLLPPVWNIPPLERIAALSALEIGLWSVAGMIVLSAIVSFVWIERGHLRLLFGLAPLAYPQLGVVVFTILFCLPVLLVGLGNNIVDVISVRYLMIAWQASSVVVAVFLSRLIQKWRIVGWLCVGFWLSFVGVNNTVGATERWIPFTEMYSPQAITALRSYMQQEQVQGGYAHYWVAYNLDFLMAEQATFAPYNLLDRYNPYSDKVSRLPVQVYIFSTDMIPASITRADELADLLATDDIRLGVFPHVAQNLRDDVVLERKQLGTLDVWLVQNRRS